MKKTLLMFLAAAAVVGCAKEESYTPSGSTDNVVKFSSGGITRVSSDGADLWESGDAIAITSVGFDNEFECVKYVSDIDAATATAATTGFDFSDTGKQITFPNTDDATVDFYAVYPYMTMGSEKDYYEVDVTNQGGDNYNYGDVDFMTASESVAYGTDHTVGAVNFDFKHRLTKVIITVGCNDNLESLAGLTASVSGIFTKRAYGINGEIYTTDQNEFPADATGSIDLTAEVVDDEKKTATVTAILHPMTIGNCKNAVMTFQVGDGDGTRTFNVGFDKALILGSIHKYEIDLGNKHPEFKSGSTITEWDWDNTTTTLNPEEVTI